MMSTSLRRGAQLAWCISATATALLAMGSVAQAASPSLGAITPFGAQRGTEIEVVFTGGNLGDAQEVMLSYPGITVTQLEATAENSVKTRLNIAPDCRIGIHAMRVRTATGITNLRTFNVGPLPEVAEVEPNNDFAAPQAIGLDVTVNVPAFA